MEQSFNNLMYQQSERDMQEKAAFQAKADAWLAPKTKNRKPKFAYCVVSEHEPVEKGTGMQPTGWLKRGDAIKKSESQNRYLEKIWSDEPATLKKLRTRVRRIDLTTQPVVYLQEKIRNATRIYSKLDDGSYRYSHVQTN